MTCSQGYTFHQIYDHSKLFASSILINIFYCLSHASIMPYLVPKIVLVQNSLSRSVFMMILYWLPDYLILKLIRYTHIHCDDILSIKLSKFDFKYSLNFVMIKFPSIFHISLTVNHS